MKKGFTLVAAWLLSLLATAPALAAGGGGDDGHHDVEHWSIFKALLPESLFQNLRGMVGPSWLGGDPNVHVSHVFIGLFVLFFGIGLMLASNKKMKASDTLLPSKSWNAFAFFDVMIEAILGLMETMMPRDKALRFLPLVTAFACFILISNLLALVPGFLPPTDNMNTTAALGLVAFIAYNYWGIRQQGFVNYMKHFMGPMPILAPLMLPIELFSHLVRPASLALRLAGNMFGDHKVLSIFLAFHLIFVPLPLMVLGTLVCVVQTLVFTLLTIVYVAMAVEEHEHHDDHGHAEAH